MAFALFGKLPAKRDFVAVNVPRPVLEPLETWLQSGIAASRHKLGARWEELYVVAPIWRFWIGRRIWGREASGVMMPSVDKVGRFFPLLLFHVCDAGMATLPPVIDAASDWNAALEARILPVLQDGWEGEPAALVEGLEPPGQQDTVDSTEPDNRDARMWASADDADAGAFLADVRAEDYLQLCAGRSFWWTVRPDGGVSLLQATNGMPGPYFLATAIGGPPQADAADS